MQSLPNPFRPGAGHMPPFLAGRKEEADEFKRLLGQSTILENLVLTGLRGVGKTVLLDTFRPFAIAAGWLWVGSDMSESTSITEQRMAMRILTDLSVVTSDWVIGQREIQVMGLVTEGATENIELSYDLLNHVFNTTPGLVADKLKAVLEVVYKAGKDREVQGIIFAYDESQNLSDHSEKDEYPLSLLLDVFQSVQKKNYPFLLALAGLPTLFPKLVEARTFAERMFRVVMLSQLNKKDSRDAITKPIHDSGCSHLLTESLIESIVKLSSGYPYFIQFICREVYDLAIRRYEENSSSLIQIQMDGIIRKLDSDFFGGRWSRATDRQRELLVVCSELPNSVNEFSVNEIAEQSKKSKRVEKPFSPSHVNQMLTTLIGQGLIYKNRHGKYSFAVPLFE